MPAKHTKSKATHTHIPTKWGVAILALLLAGMAFVVMQATSNQTQNYRSDAAGKTVGKPGKKAPTPVKRAPTPRKYINK